MEEYDKVFVFLFLQAVAWTTAAFPFGVSKPISSREEDGESPQYDDINRK